MYLLLCVRVNGFFFSSRKQSKSGGKANPKTRSAELITTEQPLNRTPNNLYQRVEASLITTTLLSKDPPPENFLKDTSSLFNQMRFISISTLALSVFSLVCSPISAIKDDSITRVFSVDELSGYVCVCAKRYHVKMVPS